MHQTMHEPTSIRDANEFPDFGGSEVEITIPRLLNSRIRNTIGQIEIDIQIAFLLLFEQLPLEHP